MMNIKFGTRDAHEKALTIFYAVCVLLMFWELIIYFFTPGRTVVHIGAFIPVLTWCVYLVDVYGIKMYDMLTDKLGLPARIKDDETFLIQVFETSKAGNVRYSNYGEFEFITKTEQGKYMFVSTNDPTGVIELDYNPTHKLFTNNANGHYYRGIVKDMKVPKKYGGYTK